MSSVVLVCNMGGTHPASLAATKKKLTTFLGPQYSVQEILSSDQGVLRRDPTSISAIVVPGGDATEQWRNGVELIAEDIQRLVQNGTSYLGLSSGGVLGSSVRFLRVGRDNLQNPRGLDGCLKLYPGASIGLIYEPPISANIYEEARIVKVSEAKSGNVASLYHFHGVTYGVSKVPGVEVLSYYEGLNEPETVVYTIPEGGKCVLTGSSPEFSPEVLQAKYPREFLQGLEEDGASFRRNLLALGLVCRPV